ncbi:ACT domain-containing protein [Clostridiaceae bacterium HSG29]|nr:ACT domain-containing protein [Clostridiaceae bacterium HSG29]
MLYMLKITGNDHVGIVARISTAISKKNANIYSAEQSVKEGIFRMKIFFSIDNKDSLNELLEEMNIIEGEYNLVIDISSEEEITD